MDIQTLTRALAQELDKVHGHDALTEEQRSHLKVSLSEIKTSYDAVKETCAALPSANEQKLQLNRLRDAILGVQAAAHEASPQLWPLIAAVSAIPAPAAKDFYAQPGEKDIECLLKHFGVLPVIRDALGNYLVSDAVQRDHPGPSPLHRLVVDRFGLLYEQLTGRQPPIKDVGPFVNCVQDLMQWLEPDGTEPVSGDAIKRAVKYIRGTKGLAE